MGYKRISPQPVIEGGTGIQSATAYAPLCGNNTSGFLSASTGQSNSGYVLTSNGSALPSWQAGSTVSMGSFTPTLSFGGASVGITYNSGAPQYGKYTKIGNVVFFQCGFSLTSKGSSTGQAAISGLPFAVVAGPDCAVSIGGITFPSTQTYAWGYYGYPDAYSITFQCVGSGGFPTAFTDAQFGSGSQANFYGFYFTS